MAFDLVARLKIIDNATAPLKRVQRTTEQLQRVINQTQKSTGLWNRATSRIQSTMSRVSSAVRRTNLDLNQFGNGLRNIAAESSRVRGLAGAFTGLAAAIGGAYAAQKLFNATVGEAAKYERSQGLITAMMGNPKKAKQFMEEINKMAIDSPLLNSQDMLAAASAFLPMTKDINRLKKLYDLSERLYVLNDTQGMEGASFALREFLMGSDATSLVERFNLNRKVLNDLKNLSFDEAVKGLDELLNKMGVTRQTINQIGNDTLAKWNQIKERMQVMFRQMGEPSLKVLNNFLTNLINKLDAGDMTRFANVGARIIQNILTGMTNTATRIYDWFSTISKSSEFQKRTTLWGKVQFMISDVYKHFLKWLKNKGAAQIASVTSDLITAIASALEKNTGPITKAALTVGTKVGSAMARGIMDAISKNPIAKWVISGGSIAGIAYDKISGLFDDDKKSKKRKSSSTRYYNPRLIKGYYHGLPYVPYDGMVARLHRGEMVLTRKEADAYRKGQAGGAKSVVITGNTFVVREEADIRKIAHQLADLIQEAAANGA
jgi:uncharacterized protein YukE